MGIFWITFEILINLVEAIMIFDFLTRHLGKKNGKIYDYQFVVGVSLFFCTVSLCDTYKFTDEITVFLYIFILIGYSFFVLNGKLYQKIFVSVVDIVLIMIINIFTMVFISTTMNVPINHIDNSNLSRFIAVIITKILFFYITRIILKTRNKDDNLINKTDWLFLLLNPLVSVISISAILDLAYRIETNKWNNNIRFIAVCIVVTNVLTYYLYIRTIKNSKSSLELSMLNQQMEYQKQHMNEIKMLYNEIGTIRHDMKNQLAYLENLIREKKFALAEEYFAKIKISIGNTSTYVETNNEAVNCIINTKISQAKSRNIRVVFHVVSDLSSVEPYDFGSIIGNLLDNAIEACEKVEMSKREIDINISKGKDNNIIIKVLNSVNEEVFKNNPALRTTKKDKAAHGFGILSCKRIVEKYNGIIKFEESDNVFSCNIMVNFVEK